MLRPRAVSMFIAALVVSVACSGEEPRLFELPPPPVPDATVPTGSTGVDARFVLRVGQSVAWQIDRRQYQRFVQYASGNASVVAVRGTGELLATGMGETEITRNFAGQVERARVTVLPALTEDGRAVATFTLSPRAGVALLGGAARQFAIVALDPAGEPLEVPVTFTATGGTISPMGLYRAGQVAGVYAVIAACVCGLADTAVVEVAPATQSTLVELKLAPKTVTVGPGGTVQFATTVRWSNGSTAVPPLAYTASGGAVSESGLYTAPEAPGKYKVIVAPDSGVIRDTAVVSVALAPENPAPLPPPIAPEVIFADGFESGDFKMQQSGVRWTSTPWVEVSTLISRSGSRSARFRQGESKSWGELRFGGLPKLEEVFIQFYMYQPSGDESPHVGPRVRVIATLKNDKFFRLWSGPYDSPFKHGASTWGINGVGMLGTEIMRNDGTRMWSMGQGGPDVMQLDKDKHPLIANPAYLGRWIRIRIRSKVATAANNDGVIQIWVDDVLASNKTDLPSYALSGIGNYFENGYILGWSNSGFAPSQNMYIDDFVISKNGFPPS